jgi:hypothetical protein
MGKSLRIIRSRVKPWNQKYSACPIDQINGTTPLVSPDERGDRDRHDRAVGSMDAMLRLTSQQMRTAKSCGSDAPVLASSSREATLLVGDGGKEAGHQDDHL